MNLQSIASSLAGIATKLLPAIIPGAAPVIAAAQDVVSLGKELLQHVGALPEGQQLQESIAALEARVVAHADLVEGELGSGPAT